MSNGSQSGRSASPDHAETGGFHRPIKKNTARKRWNESCCQDFFCQNPALGQVSIIPYIIAMKSPLHSVSLALLAAAIPGSASAATVFTGGTELSSTTAFSGGSGSGENFMQGTDFTSTTAQELTALGFWDSGADGLAASYTVGLWETSTQTLLASVTISSADPLDTSLTVEGGQWRYETLGTTVNLAAGTTYTMAFYNDTVLEDVDCLILNFPTVTSDPTVTLPNERRFLMTGGLAFPVNVASPAGIAYNGQLNALLSPVPEPGVAGLVALGALGLVKRRRK